MKSVQKSPLGRLSKIPLSVLLFVATAVVFLSNAWAENRNGVESHQANPYDLMDESHQTSPYDLMDESHKANPYDLMDEAK